MMDSRQVSEPAVKDKNTINLDDILSDKAKVAYDNWMKRGSKRKSVIRNS